MITNKEKIYLKRLLGYEVVYFTAEIERMNEILSYTNDKQIISDLKSGLKYTRSELEFAKRLINKLNLTQEKKTNDGLEENVSKKLEDMKKRLRSIFRKTNTLAMKVTIGDNDYNMFVYHHENEDLFSVNFGGRFGDFDALSLLMSNLNIKEIED